uniref:C2H2-type domain-containing protein n=1 Tax=Caenorhabditis japonica TaxID=281687 RepID=A0A8R1DV66_CAEJA
MDEEEIDVVNCEPEEKKVDTGFRCDECDYVGRTKASISAHKRHKHAKPEAEKPEKAAKPRAKKSNSSVEKIEENGTEDVQISTEAQSVEPEASNLVASARRVTTKQLLGGRRRPKTHVEAAQSDRPDTRIHEVDTSMAVGEFIRRNVNGVYTVETIPVGAQIDEQAGEMEVGNEVEVVGENVDVVPLDSLFKNYKSRLPEGTPRRVSNVKKYAPDKIPVRLTVGDETGKYKCYIEDCHWRCSYRSLRMEHMKAVHPEWKLPPRFILERISKDGVYLNPDEYVPPIACPIEGCDWRGNYRASKSAHMRKVHPREHADSKKKMPGYQCSGVYGCHFPMCTWRGWSRSTRSMHIKKAHPEWKPEDNRSMILLTCFHCKASFPSYPLLASHIDMAHNGLGLHVEEMFDSKEAFGMWLQRIERTYSITFERTDPPAQPNDEQIYTLHCTCTAGRGGQLTTDTRQFVYSRYNFLKRRQHHFLTRSKNDCSAHLEIREDTIYDRVNVKGTLEHTGHRFGTPLLRMSGLERQLYSDVIVWKTSEPEQNFRLMALELVDKLNAYEGFAMENFGPPKTLGIIEPLDPDALTSLKMIVQESDQACFFNVDFSEIEQRKVSFGYMSDEMKRLYVKFGAQRSVTIDLHLVDFQDIELHQYTVLVYDCHFCPKCVLIYLTTNTETTPEVVLQQLKTVNPNFPRDFICDASQIWPETIEKLWPENDCNSLISEWSIMEFWAAKVEELVHNEFDVFSIITALRRLVRVEDQNQLLFYALELFESLFECGYTEFAEFLDVQFSDLEYFKRWSPTYRTAYTSNTHPTLAVSSRVLRDDYLSNEEIDRPDQWFAHITKRIEDFNAIEMTQTFTLRPMELPKKYYYNTIDIQDFNKTVHEPGAETVLVYEEEVDELVEGEVVEGEVVEEEVIGHEEVDEVEMYNEDLMIKQEARDEEQKRMRYFQAGPSSSTPAASAPPSEAGSSSANIGEIPRRHFTGPRILASSAKKLEEEPERTLPSLKRDTTKSVVRGGRKKKDRFAELRDCPPEVMRAIAAHAISYDGRKKEQRPYVYVPPMAKLAQSSFPSVPTPDFYKDAGTAYTMPVRRDSRQQHAKRKQQWERQEQQARQRQIQQRQVERQMMMAEQASTSSTPRPHILQHRHRQHQHQQHLRPSEDVDEEMDADQHPLKDDQQPCTSSSLYH